MNTKKIIMAVVSVVLVLAIAIGLVAVLFNANSEKYISKGQFYELLINNFNYYSLTHSKEKIAETPNYTLEAETMVQWDLLPENIATTNIDEPITREVAALACLNTLYIKKTGDVNSIKDADLCDYPQEMADALANGIITLDNGYLDAKEKLTRDDCLKMLESTLDAKAENKYQEDEGYSKISDSVLAFSGDDLLELAEDEFVVDGYEEADQNANAHYEDAKALAAMGNTSNVSSLVYTLSESSLSNVVNLNNELKTTTFKVNIPKSFYKQHFKNCKEGQLVEYTGFAFNQPLSYNGSLTLDYRHQQIQKISPFAGKLVEVIDWEQRGTCPYGWTSTEPCVTLILEAIDDVEKMANTEVSGITRQVKNIDFEQLETSIGDFIVTISPNEDNTGIKCVATKQFELKENKYGNWRDATLHPVATFTATMDNIYFTTDQLQNFYKKSGTASLKVTCNTTESFLLESGGMRLTPDSNGNGKFWSNLTKSRFTDGKGAEEIKVAQLVPIKIPNTGLSIHIYVYLILGMDGKIEITFSQIGNGFEMTKAANGQIVVTPLESVNTTKADANQNLNIELQAKIYINHAIVLRRSVVSGYIAGGVDINAQMTLYQKVKDKMNKEKTGYGDAQEASEAIKADKSLHYCVDISGKFYIRGGLLKTSPSNMNERVTLVYAVVDLFGYDITNWTFDTRNTSKSGPHFHVHFEDGNFVDKCTIECDEQADLNVDKSNNEEFALSSYKVHINDNMCGIVYITDSPISEKEIDKNNGIKVRSKNSNVAKVYYHEKNNSITIEAVSAGSTEVEVYIQKDKTSDKMYVQTFSVTIYPTTEEQTEYSVEGVSIVIPEELVIYEGYYV